MPTSTVSMFQTKVGEVCGFKSRGITPANKPPVTNPSGFISMIAQATRCYRPAFLSSEQCIVSQSHHFIPFDYQLAVREYFHTKISASPTNMCTHSCRMGSTHQFNPEMFISSYKYSLSSLKPTINEFNRELTQYFLIHQLMFLRFAF